MSSTSTAPVRYRMPAVFGPAPDPRQKADGTPWRVEETGTMRQEWLRLEFLGVAEQLERLLPPGFELRGEPVVTLLLGAFRDRYWLAGRFYGTVHPQIPVTYPGRTESIDGDFMPVIWESLADAIITGRDELGFPKLVADFDQLNLDPAAGSVGRSVSWLGPTFFEMEAGWTGRGHQPDAASTGTEPHLQVRTPHQCQRVGRGRHRQRHHG